jgi:hypothetical protein
MSINVDEMVWSPEMGEISGFGGSYEEACQNMVRGGIRYAQENDVDFETLASQLKSCRAIFGVVDFDGEEARGFEDAIVEASGDPEGVTGAMVHAATSHSMFILANGWDAYVEKKIEKTQAE